jgi:hypothetical protein
MEQIADRVLSELGLTEHQTLLVAHHDREHKHVHALVNRIHREIFAAWDRWQDHAVLDRVLAQVEVEFGLRRVVATNAWLIARSRWPRRRSNLTIEQPVSPVSLHAFGRYFQRFDLRSRGASCATALGRTASNWSVVPTAWCSTMGHRERKPRV